MRTLPSSVGRTIIRAVTGLLAVAALSAVATGVTTGTARANTATHGAAAGRPAPDIGLLSHTVATDRRGAAVEGSRTLRHMKPSAARGFDDRATDLAGLPNTPYMVWVENGGAVALSARLYWTQSNMSGVGRTGGPVNPINAFRLGGSYDCSLIVAYILDIYYGDVLVATTGIVDPVYDTDGFPCDDGWYIG